MLEDICYNIHVWQQKYWNQPQCSKLGDKLRKLWYLQKVDRTALQGMFVVSFKYYNKHFSC